MLSAEAIMATYMCLTGRLAWYPINCDTVTLEEFIL